MPNPPKFFLTHSWKDIEFARKLADDLKARGMDGFFDFYSVRPGDNIADRISHGLDECDVYVPVLSFESLRSPWCKEEINAAISLSNEPKRNGRPRIIPVLIENCQSELPVFMRSRLYINFTARYEEALQELLQKGFALDVGESTLPAPEKAKAESVAPRIAEAQTRVSKPVEETLPRPKANLWRFIFVGLLVAIGICVVGGSVLLPLLFPPISSTPQTPSGVAPTSASTAVSSSPVTLPPGNVSPSLTPTPTSSRTGILLTLTPTPTPTSSRTLVPLTLTPTPTPSRTVTLLAPTPLGGGSGEIAFASERDGNREIYLMNADGTNVRRLTNNAAVDSYPSWSPDGRFITFQSERDLNGNIEIYVMNADGSNPLRRTTDAADDHYPAWSPDGRIAFASTRDGNREIYVMNSDGTQQQRRTTNPASDFSPAWSPDGRLIAFASNRDGNYEIYVMNENGTNQHRLTNNPAFDDYPAWSPDGRLIAFQSNRDGNYQIYVMNADGSNQRRLSTNTAVEDHFPAWSPDGRLIAFYSDRDGNNEIYVMNADGNNQRRLTNNAAVDAYPAWRPSIK